MSILFAGGNEMRNKLVGFLSVVTILAVVLSGCSGSVPMGETTAGTLRAPLREMQAAAELR